MNWNLTQFWLPETYTHFNSKIIRLISAMLNPSSNDLFKQADFKVNLQARLYVSETCKQIGSYFNITLVN